MAYRYSTLISDANNKLKHVNKLNSFILLFQFVTSGSTKEDKNSFDLAKNRPLNDALARAVLKT